MTMLGVEAEIAFVFEQGLEARNEPYDDADVLAAVREARVAIEVCDSRLDDWERADDFVKLADHQLNFALVLGDACAQFRDIDFGALPVLTRVDGKILRQGVGCHALGNPLRLLPWLANHARHRGGIAAGTAVTTGAWLGLHRVEPGSSVAVEFDGLGRAEVSFPLVW
jgi:2-keto-4-pentenoate hydratase